MAYVKKKSVLPVYLVGLTWLLWAVFGKLYRPTHYILAAAVSVAVFFVSKMLWPDRAYETSAAQEEAPKAEAP